MDYCIKNKKNNNIQACSNKNNVNRHSFKPNFRQENDSFVNGSLDRRYLNIALASQNNPAFKGFSIVKAKAVSDHAIEETLELIGHVEKKDEAFFRNILEEHRNGNNKLSYSHPLKSIMKTLQAPFKQSSDLEKNVDQFLGICENIRAWKKENLNREQILDKLRHDKLSSFDTSKGNYASNKLTPLIRLASGSTTAVFYAFDFYNSSISVDNNPKKAKAFAKQKLKQEMTSVALTAGLLFFVTSIFKRACNRSIKTSLAVYLGTVAFAEVVSRIVNHRPLLPLSSQKAKKVDTKTRIKPYDFPKNSIYTGFKSDAALNKYSTPFSSKLTFTGATGNVVSRFVQNVKGKYSALSVAEEYGREDLAEVMRLIKVQFPDQHNWMSNVIVDNLAQFKDTSHLTGKTLDELLTDSSVKRIPIGKTEKFTKTVIDGLLSPVLMAVRGIKSVHAKLTGRMKTNQLKEEFAGKVEDVKNLVGFVQKNIEHARRNNLNVDEYVLGELRKKKLYSTDSVSYDATILSNSTRLVNILPGALFCMDIYNLMMQQSNGDKDYASHETKDRSKQVALKLILSAYVIQLTNRLFKKVYNKSILGLVLVASGSTVLYEVLTRKLLNVHVLPKKADSN